MQQFLPVAGAALFAAMLILLRVFGVPRKELQVFAASPFVVACLALLLFPLVVQGEPLFGRAALQFMTPFVVSIVPVTFVGIALRQLVRFREQVERVRGWLASERPEPEFRWQGLDELAQCFDAMAERIAVKFVSGEPLPRGTAIAYEDWSELTDAVPIDGAHMIVPISGMTTATPVSAPDVVRLLPRNSFPVVIVVIDTSQDEACFTPASDAQFCAKVMQFVRSWRE